MLPKPLSGSAVWGLHIISYFADIWPLSSLKKWGFIYLPKKKLYHISQIYSCMLDRMKDKVPGVRVQAVNTLNRLQVQLLKLSGLPNGSIGSHLYSIFVRCVCGVSLCGGVCLR